MIRSSCVWASLAGPSAVRPKYAAAAHASVCDAIAGWYSRGALKSIAAAVTLAAALVPLAAATGHAQPSQMVVPFDIAAGPPRYAWTTMSTPVVLHFDDAVPRQVEITRLARTVQDRAWHLADSARVTLATGAASIDGPIGVDTLLIIRAVDRPEYLLDGPFRWPSKPSTYYVRTEWRKTIRGTFSGVRGTLEWIPADEQGGRVACEWRGREDWECVGVPLQARGVVVMITSGQVTCGIPAGLPASSGIDAVTTRRSAWGRLMLVHGPSGGPSGPVRIRAKGADLQAARQRATGRDQALDTNLHIDQIAEGVVWVAGGEVRQDEWVEIEAPNQPPERVEIRELTGGPADLPLRVQLRQARTRSGGS
jgi:hypothetical protein